MIGFFITSNLSQKEDYQNVDSKQDIFPSRTKDSEQTTKNNSHSGTNGIESLRTVQGKYPPSTPTEEAISILMGQRYNQRLSDIISIAHSNPSNTLIQYIALTECRGITDKVCYTESFIRNILNNEPKDALAKGYLTNHYLSLGDEHAALEALSNASLEDKTFPYFREVLKAVMENYEKNIQIKNPNPKFTYPVSDEEIIISAIGVAIAQAIPDAALLKTCKKNNTLNSWRDACYNYGTIYKKNNHTLMELSLGDAYQRTTSNKEEKENQINHYITKLITTMGKVESSGKFNTEQQKLYLEDLYEYGEQKAMEQLFERLGFEY